MSSHACAPARLGSRPEEDIPTLRTFDRRAHVLCNHEPVKRTSLRGMHKVGRHHVDRQPESVNACVNCQAPPSGQRHPVYPQGGLGFGVGQLPKEDVRCVLPHDLPSSIWIGPQPARKRIERDLLRRENPCLNKTAPDRSIGMAVFAVVAQTHAGPVLELDKA